MVGTVLGSWALCWPEVSRVRDYVMFNGCEFQRLISEKKSGGNCHSPKCSLVFGGSLSGVLQG